MKTRPNTKEEFEKDLKRLYFAAFDAQNAYQIWWLFINKEERSEYGSTMNHYAHFFSLSIRAFFIDMLMALCKIYDKSHGRNLGKFIESAKKAGFIKPRLAKKAESLILKVAPTVSKLHILRNNYYAHIQLDVETVYKMVGIKPNNFRDIIKLTISLLDNVAISTTKGKLSFDSHGLETTRRILNALQAELGG